MDRPDDKLEEMLRGVFHAPVSGERESAARTRLDEFIRNRSFASVGDHRYPRLLQLAGGAAGLTIIVLVAAFNLHLMAGRGTSSPSVVPAATSSRTSTPSPSSGADAGCPTDAAATTGALLAQGSFASAFDTVHHQPILFGARAGAAETWIYQANQWRKLSTSGGPSLRFGLPAMAFDESRGAVLLYGGSAADGQALFDTWKWQGCQWTQSQSATSPTLGNPVMAFDGATDRTIMFGLNGNQAETWSWDGTSWAQVKTVRSPAPRAAPALAFDRTSKRIILFGGWTSSSGELSDTWTFDGTAWQEEHPQNSPSPRLSASMSAGLGTKGPILFGGARSHPSPTGNHVEALGDMWQWDGANWLSIQAAGPAPRRDAGLVGDAAQNVHLLFGGRDANGAVSDMWSWNGTAWTRLG